MPQSCVFSLYSRHVALNKINAIDKPTQQEILTQFQQVTSAPIFLISAVAQEGLTPLLQTIWQTLDDLSP